MKFNSSQITLILILGVVAYLSSLTLGASTELRARESKAYYPGKKAQRSGLLENFILSFAGNFDFSQVVDGLKKIFEGVATCKFLNHLLDKNKTYFYFFIPISVTL